MSLIFAPLLLCVAGAGWSCGLVQWVLLLTAAALPVMLGLTYGSHAVQRLVVATWRNARVTGGRIVNIGMSGRWVAEHHSHLPWKVTTVRVVGPATE